MPSTNLPEDIFDVRKRERFLQEGLLTREQVDAYLAGLEDCADDAEVSGVQMVAHVRHRGGQSGQEPGAEEDEG